MRHLNKYKVRVFKQVITPDPGFVGSQRKGDNLSVVIPFVFEVVLFALEFYRHHLTKLF